MEERGLESVENRRRIAPRVPAITRAARSKQGGTTDAERFVIDLVDGEPDRRGQQDEGMPLQVHVGRADIQTCRSLAKRSYAKGW